MGRRIIMKEECHWNEDNNINVITQWSDDSREFLEKKKKKNEINRERQKEY